ncbi:MAG: hypothetical protein H6985_06200 [Pseudomonadales bacterium]|nr:hypothetical protein [Pseudomonadales bacterium]
MAANALQQICILLDTRIPLEAMVLQRLYRLPKERQSEWLRQLLLTAFRSECQVLKSEPPLSARAPLRRPPDLNSYKPGKRASDQASQQTSKTVASPSNDSHSSTHRLESTSPTSMADTAKPFTHLRRVIGE